MKIGIIGVGNVGGALATRLVGLGHDVTVTNSRGGESLDAAAREVGATPGTLAETTQDAEVVIIAVPVGAIKAFPAGFLSNAKADVAVVEAGNYWPTRDGYLPEIEEGLPESRWTQRQLGHEVIKAFNGTKPVDLIEEPRAAGDPDRLAFPVAGDDEAAKATVRALIDELGFDSVDTGGTDDSWRQEPWNPVFALQAKVDGVVDALARATTDRPDALRATAEERGRV